MISMELLMMKQQRNLASMLAMSLLCIFAVLPSRGDSQDCKSAGSGPYGNAAALQKLIRGDKSSLTDEESFARHVLWLFCASRIGFFPAQVRLEQRAYQLLRRGKSPKAELRRVLDIVKPTKQEEAAGLGSLVNYLKAVLDNDKVKARKLRLEMMSLGFAVLSEKESEFLACGANDVLLPYAQGVAYIFKEKSRPLPPMPMLLYQIPSCVYVPWSRGARKRFAVGVDVEIVSQKGFAAIGRERARLADDGGRLLIVARIETADADVKKGEISSAIDRVLARYGLCIGSDVRVCGKKTEARSAAEIAETAVRELASPSSAQRTSGPSSSGCAAERPSYVIDVAADHFDFDQAVYVTRRVDHYSSVEEIVAEAERMLVGIYGKSVIDERPWRVTDFDDCYLINGTLPEGMLGGVAQLKVRKNDGFVWVYYHGK